MVPANRPEPTAAASEADDQADVYRVGLLVDSTRVSKWVRDLVDWADAQSHIDIVALIIHSDEEASKGGMRKFFAYARKQGVYRAISRSTFSLLTAAERRLLLRRAHSRDHVRKHAIGERVATHLRVQPERSRSGFVCRFPEKDVQKVRDLELDALVRCGSGILKGGILQAARDGVISIHHGDNRINRGAPPAFWEVLQAEPQTGFIVQRLNEELDGGEVLFRGSVTTELFFAQNLASLTDRATRGLAHTLDLLARRQAQAEEPHIYDQQLYRTPSLADTLRYLLKTGARVAKRVYAGAVGRESHWGVAYVFQDWRAAVLWRGKELPCPKGSFIADPFAIQVDGSHYVFVEEFIYSARKGVISAYRVERGGAERLGTVLEEPYHLSFPFLFRHEDQIYMVPEGAADQSIKLYRCSRFPDQWTLAKVLMTGVDAVDTILFPDQGRWWMITTIRQGGEGPRHPELHAFWSDSPLGDWTPHRLNPLVTEAGERVRNAGFLRDGSHIYRVAQRDSFRRYGAGFSIHRIDELDPDSYSESLVQRVQPNFLSGLAGTHHIHSDHGLTVYDYCRELRPGRR